MPKRSCAFLALLCVIVAVASAQSGGDSSARAVVAHARKMYYSLQQAGVRELKCYARPDWPEVLASIPSSTADSQRRPLPYLSNSVFKVIMTESGTNVTVDKSANHAPEQLASDLANIVEFVRSDIQQVFDVWRMITFKPLLPSLKSVYRLEHYAGKYDLIDGEQQLELDETGLIQEIRGSIPSEHVTISMPLHYVESSNGLVLSSLSIRNANEPSQHLEMTVKYLEQDGLQLPAAIDCKSQHPFGKVSTKVKTDRCEVVRG